MNILVILTYIKDQLEINNIVKYEYYPLEELERSFIDPKFIKYEYIEGEGVKMPKIESDLDDLKSLKVNFIDTVGDDNIIYRNGTAYVVDNDNSYTSISSEISPWCQWVAGLFKNVCFN